MISTILKTKNLNLFGNSSVFCTCLFDVKLVEDDVKIEKHRSIRGFYVKVYF
jgi:hypothetical protein